MLLGILHHGITVSDIDTATDWYQNTLGLELVHRQRSNNEYIKILVGVPNAVLEVSQFCIPNGMPRVSTHDLELIQYVEGSRADHPPKVNQVGVAHLAFLVSDIESLHRKAESQGASFRNKPTRITEGANAGGFGCYLHDPDGNTLEFIQPSEARLEEIRKVLRAADQSLSDSGL